MTRNWKFLLTAMLLVVVLAFAACGSDDGEEDTSTTNNNQQQAGNQPPAGGGGNDDDTGAPPPPPPAPSRDLGGMHITIGNWWSDWNVSDAEPTTAEAEARLFDRIDAFEEYNFSMEVRRMGDWGGVRDMIPVEIMAGSREVHIWHMEPSWFAAMVSQNLFAPLADSYFDAATGLDWHRSTLEASRRNGVIHGFALGPITGGGIYFNMRLFEDAGLDPHLPFDLQMRGEWTWDAFMDIARATTRDLTGDGSPDTFGLVTFGADFLERAIVSNGAMFTGMDDDGNFVNMTTTPEFLEALTWANSLADEGVLMFEPEGTGWDFFVAAFNNGMAAMRSAGNYVAGAHINPNLEDPWGFVAFPMGPRANTHLFHGNHNFQAIPVNFSQEEVDDIMFAFHQWYRPLEGFDDPNAWMAGAFTVHYSERSVEETMALFTRNGDLMRPNFNGFIPGIPTGPQFGWRIWNNNDPAVIVEEAQPVWNTYINNANSN